MAPGYAQIYWITRVVVQTSHCLDCAAAAQIALSPAAASSWEAIKAWNREFSFMTWRITAVRFMPVPANRSSQVLYMFRIP